MIAHGVDVLAVLDSAAGASNEIFRLAGSRLQRELGEARATVAELIAQRDAAVASLTDAVEWIAALRSDDATTHPRLKVLRATLARCNGGAA